MWLGRWLMFTLIVVIAFSFMPHSLRLSRASDLQDLPNSKEPVDHKEIIKPKEVADPQEVVDSKEIIKPKEVVGPSEVVEPKEVIEPKERYNLNVARKCD